MIARIWAGATQTSDAAEYQEYMDRVAMPGYAEVAGNRLVLMLRRERGDHRTDFTMITLWDNAQAIRSFTGRDTGKAVFYPQDHRFLVERGSVPRHHEVYALCGIPESRRGAHHLESCSDQVSTSRREPPG